MRDLAGPLFALLADPQHSAVLCDFDGTLAPIQDDPGSVEPLPGVPQLLADLTERFGVVAVVSGRPATFLVQVLGADLRLSGAYGLESVVPGTGGQVERLPGLDRWTDVVAAEAARLEAAAPVGVLVERKGTSFTVHYRTAPELGTWAESAVEEASSRSGLQVHAARLSLELRPPVRIDKGAAVEALARGCAAGCFIGDDVGDLPAFAALDDLAAIGMSTVKVLVDSPEAAPEMRAGADLVVDGPTGAVALLHHLLDGAA